jgi:hypothetical protein
VAYNPGVCLSLMMQADSMKLFVSTADNSSAPGTSAAHATPLRRDEQRTNNTSGGVPKVHARHARATWALLEMQTHKGRTRDCCSRECIVSSGRFSRGGGRVCG